MRRGEWTVLRVDLERLRGGRLRGRYSQAVRARVGAEVRQARQRGEPWRSIAGGLGISVESVRRWSAAPGGSFRAVEVVADEPGDAQGSESGAALILTTRSGHRVEGLDLCGMARLLREIA